MNKTLESAVSIIKEFYTEAKFEDFSIVGSGFGSLIIKAMKELF